MSLSFSLMLWKVLPATKYKYCSLSSIYLKLSTRFPHHLASTPIFIFLALWKDQYYISQFSSAKSAKFCNLLWNDVFSAGQGWWWTAEGIKREKIPTVWFLLLPHAASTCCQLYCGETWDLYSSELRVMFSPEQQRSRSLITTWL